MLLCKNAKPTLQECYGADGEGQHGCLSFAEAEKAGPWLKRGLKRLVYFSSGGFIALKLR
jgi:hypothetical protein